MTSTEPSNRPQARLSRELRNWYTAGAYLEVQGHRIFYRDSHLQNDQQQEDLQQAGLEQKELEQEKDVILLIHGFPTAGWDWHHVWGPLSENYRLISIDMLGFGFSDKPLDYHYTIHAQADLIEAVLSRLGISKAHVLAHDYGDTVAQELAARHLENPTSPLRMITLTLLNGGLFPEQHRARFIQKLLTSPVGPLISRLATQATFAKNLNAVFGSDTQLNAQALDDLWQLFSFNDGHQKSHRMLHYMADRRQHRERWVGALQKLDVPLLLINGTEDPVSGGHMADYYETLIPDPAVVRLEGIGHYPQLEAPQAVLQAFLPYVRAVSQKK